MRGLLEAPEPIETDILKRRIEDLEQELQNERLKAQEERARSSGALKSLARLRSQLQPLYGALRAVFGELDSVGIEPNGNTPETSSGPLDAARYAPWKEKYRGHTASAIDILVKYEAGLSRKQLASFLRVEPGSGTMSQIIFKLNKAELIVKDGNLLRLKRL